MKKFAALPVALAVTMLAPTIPVHVRLAGVAALQAGDKPKTDPQAPYVKLPATKSARPNFPFVVKADTNCKGLKWTVPAGLYEPDPELFPKVVNGLVLAGDAGTYTIKCFGSLNDVFSDEATCVVTVGTSPPGPGPGPVPSGLA